MKNRFYFKLATIVALILALLLPQGFMLDLVHERTTWRYQAFDTVERSWPGRQTLAAPVLVVPYLLTCNSMEKVFTEGKGEQEIVKETTVRETLYIIPKQLTVRSSLENSLRYRGIYAVPVYNSRIEVTGEFSTQALSTLLASRKDCKIRWEKPELSVLVSDQRGIATQPDLLWNGGKIAFQPSSHLPGTEQGMNAPLPELPSGEAVRLPFAFTLDLHGMQGLHFALVAENTDVQTSANWPHPSFTGGLLPETHDITDKGFTARWRASSFSLNVAGALERCSKHECSSLLGPTVGFELVQPVDIYQQAERSIKYAVLLIVLTFVALILFELLKQLRIHPIQYLLVGMALLVFYLLLISLSEHILFLYAYSAGATACTLLLTVYFGGILRSGKLGLLLGLGLSVLYTVLYVILQSEESALLMGSVLTFVVLAVLMLATRHFDWYALTRQSEQDAELVTPK
ncbi:cell envelope integrity protein CreD [Methylovulum miyakonense]|uniref:cell envelope integrity protein CreD n=1 Tax=Methylovulum miyakonense TaxID=645578 RepID=UPI00036C8D61|nr:cell envelope integrity protein CreD [Methylovulum miyakonense]